METKKAGNYLPFLKKTALCLFRKNVIFGFCRSVTTFAHAIHQVCAPHGHSVIYH